MFVHEWVITKLGDQWVGLRAKRRQPWEPLEPDGSPPEQIAVFGDQVDEPIFNALGQKIETSPVRGILVIGTRHHCFAPAFMTDGTWDQVPFGLIETFNRDDVTGETWRTSAILRAGLWQQRRFDGWGP